MKETGSFCGVRTTLKFRKPMWDHHFHKHVEVDFPNPDRHHVFFPNYPVNFERLCFFKVFILKLYISVQGADIHPLFRAFWCPCTAAVYITVVVFCGLVAAILVLLAASEICPLPHNKQCNTFLNNLHTHSYIQNVKTKCFVFLVLRVVKTLLT